MRKGKKLTEPDPNFQLSNSAPRKVFRYNTFYHNNKKIVNLCGFNSISNLTSNLHANSFHISNQEYMEMIDEVENASVAASKQKIIGDFLVRNSKIHERKLKNHQSLSNNSSVMILELTNEENKNIFRTRNDGIQIDTTKMEIDENQGDLISVYGNATQIFKDLKPICSAELTNTCSKHFTNERENSITVFEPQLKSLNTLSNNAENLLKSSVLKNITKCEKCKLTSFNFGKVIAIDSSKESQSKGLFTMHYKKLPQNFMVENKYYKLKYIINHVKGEDHYNLRVLEKGRFGKLLVVDDLNKETTSDEVVSPQILIYVNN